jgi:hypothetical protein
MDITFREAESLIKSGADCQIFPMYLGIHTFAQFCELRDRDSFHDFIIDYYPEEGECVFNEKYGYDEWVVSRPSRVEILVQKYAD